MSRTAPKTANAFPPNLLGAHRYTTLRVVRALSEGLADGIAHKSRGQKGNLHFPFGAKKAPTPLCNLRTGLPQKSVAILI